MDAIKVNKDINELVKRGCLRSLMLFYKIYENEGILWTPETCTWAAVYGHLNCLQYLYQNGFPWNEQTCKSAALNGHIKCLKYAHENGCPWNLQTCCYAAYKGHFDCLKYAHENGCPWNSRTCCYAAENGQLECIKYLHQNGCPWDEGTCYHAAINGHFDCLKYAHENGCPWSTDTCFIAAYKGHFDCLKYAHENGCPWNSRTCCYAAENGQLECIKYLHQNGCPWDEGTCYHAAINGHFDCLKYAHENGCPWSSDTYYRLVINGHIECLKYAYENGCPYPKEVFSIIAKKILFPKWRTFCKCYQFIIYLKKRNVQKANTALRIIIDTIINDNRSLVDRIVEINLKIDKYQKIADTSLLKQTRKVKAQLDQLRCFEKKSIKTVANVSNLTKQVHDDIPESSVGEDSTCIVCMVDSKSHLAVPCGHQLACKECSTKLNICPICRESVQQWIMVRVV